jgi:hypothetical protein
MTREEPPALAKAVHVLCLVFCLAIPCLASAADYPDLESSFKEFLGTYIQEIKNGNADYLKTVYPGLPEEKRGFFMGNTLDMMKHAHENNLSPSITCREYEICKATWPQPGDSWAAQTFVRRDGKWQWLDY